VYLKFNVRIFLAELADHPILAEYRALYDYEGDLFEKSNMTD